MWVAILIELLILVILARTGHWLHYLAVIVSGWLCFLAWGTIGKGHDPFGADIGAYGLATAIIAIAARIFWFAVRNPGQVSSGFEEWMVLTAAQDALAGGDRTKAKNPMGNVLLAERLVDSLKDRKEK